MSIEKMECVNIVGLKSNLDSVLKKIVESKCFHIEPSIKTISKSGGGFKQLQEVNPYTDLLKRILNLDFGDELEFKRVNFDKIENKSDEEITEFVDKIETQTQEINKEIKKHRDSLKENGEVLVQLTHLQDMDEDLEKFFNCKHIKVRFGKLPVDSFPKLDYYKENAFEFVPYDKGENYYWGVYFAPLSYFKEADRIMKNLYFERIWVPQFATGTPQEESRKLSANIKETEEKLRILEQKRSEVLNECFDMLNMVYCKVNFRYNIFSFRKNASILKDKFYLVGFVPKRKVEGFKKLFGDLPDVSIVVRPPDAEPGLSTPVQLKNSRFSRPFSMFVKMYGLPSYNGFNPTSFVAITYTILFGIMFGDLGQGLAIALLGLIINKKTGSELGAIFTRVGLSSAIFGIFYGSVFGFEHLLDPFYKKIGLENKPIEIMDNTLLILAGAICIGILLIIISIIINIITQLKRRDYESALFGNNGVTGLVFFGALITGIASTVFLEDNLFTPIYIIFLLVFPILIMFFRKPLGCLISGKRFKMGNVGDFISSNFFEVFEFMLGYATNTLSFVRIGGFVFSHAGMMSVVMILSEGVSRGASPIVIIIGNLFVMGMEGLIVGIQVLRLEFYEMFSRFYDGDGRPFEPVKISYKTISDSE
ncbi:MAG: ATPase [Clostridiales bacterium]|nr:ATPase [Clostridiales bacterium]